MQISFAEIEKGAEAPILCQSKTESLIDCAACYDAHSLAFFRNDRIKTELNQRLFIIALNTDLPILKAPHHAAPPP